MMATNPNRGFATLTITLVLVVLLVAVSVFVGRVLISDKRITLNEIEYRVTLAAAEKGIAEAMATLRVDPARSDVSGSIASSAATASYQVTMTQDTPMADAWQLESVAMLGGDDRSTVKVQVAKRSILNPAHAGPAAPLVVAGNLPANGTITFVANPNGGGNGVPVSIWSKDAVTLGGNAVTCSLGAYEQGNCLTDFYSNSFVSEPDIVANDPGFPDDLLEYLFGVPDNAQGWAYLEDNATAIMTSCNGTSIQDGGFYIIKGVSSCTIDSNLGENEPVLIVLKDSSLTINSNREIHGLLFAYDSNPDDASTHTVKINGNAKFYGAMISNHDEIELPNGNYDAVYDPDVLFRLMGGEGEGGDTNPFVNMHTIPGSWKDW